MKMRARHPSRRTHQAHHHTLGNLLALMYSESRQVREQRIQSLPVVDDDGAAREKQIFGKHDTSCAG